MEDKIMMKFIFGMMIVVLLILCIMTPDEIDGEKVNLISYWFK